MNIIGVRKGREDEGKEGKTKERKGRRMGGSLSN
jgi:hypothetical protein